MFSILSCFRTTELFFCFFQFPLWIRFTHKHNTPTAIGCPIRKCRWYKSLGKTRKSFAGESPSIAHEIRCDFHAIQRLKQFHVQRPTAKQLKLFGIKFKFILMLIQNSLFIWWKRLLKNGIYFMWRKKTPSRVCFFSCFWCFFFGEIVIFEYQWTC